MATYEDLVREARKCLEADHPSREDRESLRGLVDSGDIYDLAHEYAAGHFRVIYTAESRALWDDGVSTEYESDADDLGPPESIDAWITLAAYCTLRAAFTDAVDEYLEAHPDDELDASLSTA